MAEYDQRDIEKAAKEQGFRVGRTKRGHPVFYPPDPGKGASVWVRHSVGRSFGQESPGKASPGWVGVATREVRQVTEWSADIEAVSQARLDEDFADSVLEKLAPYAPALRVDANRLDVRFSVDAPSASEAFAQALKLFDKALPGAETVRAAIETAEDLDRTLAASNVPDLVGVAELADLLRVSRQRASELARGRGFPKPWVVLKAGPVWKRSSVARFASRWSRQPGRPRRITAV